MKMISTRRGGVIRGWITMLLLVVLLVAIGGWFVARSQRFRVFVSGRLSAQLGMPVQITHSYIGWPYVLVLRGVAVEDDAFQAQVRMVRLGRHGRRWSLEVRGARIVFAPQLLGEDAYRLPAILVRVADMREPGALDIMRATSHLQPRWRIWLQEVDLIWHDEDEQVVSAVRQLQFRMQPVRLPSRELVYYRVSYPGTAEHAFGEIRDLDWEWLTGGGDDYIELQRGGVVPPFEMCE